VEDVEREGNVVRPIPLDDHVVVAQFDPLLFRRLFLFLHHFRDGCSVTESEQFAKKFGNGGKDGCHLTRTGSTIDVQLHKFELEIEEVERLFDGFLDRGRWADEDLLEIAG